VIRAAPHWLGVWLRAWQALLARLDERKLLDWEEAFLDATFVLAKKGAAQSLVRRLRQHYSGQKNGSVFRRFLGGALIRSQNPDSPCLMPAPGRGHWELQDADTCDLCRPVETQVSSVLRNNFTFRCVEVGDREEHNRLEDRLIATVSFCAECTPSPTWLGRFAYSSAVRDCGMWNSQSVGGMQLSSDELKRLEALVNETATRWNLKPNS